jgi:hypothetical protein
MDSTTQEQDVHEAVDRALEALAAKLGGTSDLGGPVTNATRIEGRPQLGVLLTDLRGYVLGRVWLHVNAPPAEAAAAGVSVPAQVTVRSEMIAPPEAVDTWLKRQAR